MFMGSNVQRSKVGFSSYNIFVNDLYGKQTASTYRQIWNIPLDNDVAKPAYLMRISSTHFQSFP